MMAVAALLGFDEDQVGVAYGIVLALSALLLLCCFGLYYCYARDKMRRPRKQRSRPIMVDVRPREGKAGNEYVSKQVLMASSGVGSPNASSRNLSPNASARHHSPNASARGGLGKTKSAYVGLAEEGGESATLARGPSASELLGTNSATPCSRIPDKRGSTDVFRQQGAGVVTAAI